MFGVGCHISVDIRSGGPRAMHEPQRETWNHCSHLLAAVFAHSSLYCPAGFMSLLALPHEQVLFLAISSSSNCSKLKDCFS